MRLGRRLERRLAHDVLGPVADVATGVDKPLEQLVFGQPADHDRLPDDHGLCQQTLSKVHFVLDALEDGQDRLDGALSVTHHFECPSYQIQEPRLLFGCRGHYSYLSRPVSADDCLGKSIISAPC